MNAAQVMLLLRAFFAGQYQDPTGPYGDNLLGLGDVDEETGRETFYIAFRDCHLVFLPKELLEGPRKPALQLVRD